MTIVFLQRHFKEKTSTAKELTHGSVVETWIESAIRRTRSDPRLGPLHFPEAAVLNDPVVKSGLHKSRIFAAGEPPLPDEVLRHIGRFYVAQMLLLLMLLLVMRSSGETFAGCFGQVGHAYSNTDNSSGCCRLASEEQYLKKI